MEGITNEKTFSPYHKTYFPDCVCLTLCVFGAMLLILNLDTISYPVFDQFNSLQRCCYMQNLFPLYPFIVSSF